MSFIDILQGFGNAETFLIVTGVLVGLTMLLPWLRQRLGIKLEKATTDGASDAFKAVVSSMIFVLAFALYQVQANFHDAEQLVEKEANQLNLMDRALLRYGTPEAVALRGLEIEYCNLVINKEWELMQVSGRSSDVDAVFEKLVAGERTLAPTGPAQQAQLGVFQRSLDETYDLREARLAMTNKSLPSLYWSMISGLLILLAFLALFTNATLDKQMGHAGLICAVGLLLSLVIIIDGPFKGDTSVQPDAIKHVLKVIQSRHTT
jgi:hypothetical protein